jgi:hypothetical protein
VLKSLENIPVLQAFRKGDRHLLLNHPRLWALRLPWLVVYFVLANAVALLIPSLVPLNIDQTGQFHFWLWFGFAIEGIVMALWWRVVDRFSPPKAFVRTFPISGLWDVVVYMLCVVVFLSPGILGSFILEHRYSDMILATPIEADRKLVRTLEYNTVFPQDVVERYSNWDYETYLEFSETEQMHTFVNFLINSKINSLYKVATYQDAEWQTFLIGMILMLHLGVVMFISRHFSPDMEVRALAYGAIAVMLLGILEIVGMVIFEYSYQGNPYEETNFLETYTRCLLILMSLAVLFFSLRVFWQKRFKTFTAINIILLPYVVFGFQFVILDILADHYDAIDHLLYFTGFLTDWYGNYWDEVIKYLFLGTPIFILWVFIPIKAMYTRLLALPEG